MGRHRSGGSYSHRCKPDGDEFLISWTVDYYYKGDRLRYPRGSKRWTDRAGALRFCKRWGLQFTEPKGDG